MKLRPIITLALMTVFLGGCLSTFGMRPKGYTSLVERSAAQRPGWIERGTYLDTWLEKGAAQPDPSYFFVGRVDDAEDLALGEEEAEYRAKRAIASAVRETVNGYFRETRSGPNRSSVARANEKELESLTSAIINKVQIRGVMPVERYWEKFERVMEDGGVAYGYNVYLLVRVPEDEFRRMKEQIVTEVDDTRGSPLRKR